MKGSGIYSQSYTGEFDCDECGKTFELDGDTNDWQTEAYADCPECGEQLTVELPDPDARDEDADYDDWRDSQLFD